MAEQGDGARIAVCSDTRDVGPHPHSDLAVNQISHRSEGGGSPSESAGHAEGVSDRTGRRGGRRTMPKVYLGLTLKYIFLIGRNVARRLQAHLRTSGAADSSRPHQAGQPGHCAYHCP
jgi:hypothetical protein